MNASSKRMASCAVTAALGVTLMLLGGVLELGMYACPLLVGLSLVPLGEQYGRKYHALVFLTVSLLSFLLVPNVEENLVFAGFFGWYPIARPALQRLPKGLRRGAKLLLFNGAIVAVEWLVTAVLAPAAMDGVWLWVLLAMGDLVFLAYDHLIPRAGLLLRRLRRRG